MSANGTSGSFRQIHIDKIRGSIRSGMTECARPVHFRLVCYDSSFLVSSNFPWYL